MTDATGLEEGKSLSKDHRNAGLRDLFVCFFAQSGFYTFLVSVRGFIIVQMYLGVNIRFLFIKRKKKKASLVGRLIKIDTSRF